MLFGLTAPENLKDIDQMNPNERKIWRRAVNKELKSMEKHQVWDVVPYTGQEKISTRWIFRVKDEEEAKARLVARGFQSNNYSDTYAPVADITSIRIFLAVAIHRKMKIVQVDVETAFLNGELKEEIFIQPPEGTNLGSDVVLRLRKALYGLKQSPLSWYETIDGILSKNDFRKCVVESCLYIHSLDLFLIVYVDDFLIAAKCEDSIKFVLDLLKDTLEIKTFQKPKKFVGLSLNIGDTCIEIDQVDYIAKCVKRLGLENSKVAKTPMEVKLDLSKTNSNSDLCVLKFQKLLGMLNYVMERTRIDIYYATNVLSRKVKVANEEYYKYLLRVLRYLKGNANVKLVYSTNEESDVIVAHCDASWSSEEESRSTTGYLIKVFDNLVCFKSRKQTLVSLSTAEAEFVALSDCSRDVMWIRNMIEDLGVKDVNAIIYCDNQAAVKIAENKGNSKRTRHIDIKFNHVKDLVNRGLINLRYVVTDDNLADFLTKSVPLSKISVVMSRLGFKS